MESSRLGHGGFGSPQLTENNIRSNQPAYIRQALAWLFTATENTSYAMTRDFVAVSRRAKALSAAQRTT